MASSQPSHNVEFEAAKFLQKLIRDSTDEPEKLATKLYVILEHMKTSGKEHSLPFQVISRAMETVISQHGLDLEALVARIPPTGGSQMGDAAGSSQAVGVTKDSKVGLAENEISKSDPFTSSRPPIAPSGVGQDFYQGSGTHRSSQSFDYESPSSLDTRSANSQSQERGANLKDGKKAAAKRKRGDSSLPSEQHMDNNQQHDARSAVVNQRKAKTNKIDSPGSFPARGSENAGFNVVPSGGHLEVSSAHVSSGQQGGSLMSAHENLSSRSAWNQNKAGLLLERSQVPRFSSNLLSGNVMAEVPMQQSTTSSLGAGPISKVQGGMPVTSGSYPMGELGFSGQVPFSTSEFQKHGLAKGAVTSPEKTMEAHFLPANRVDDLPVSLSTGRVENDGGSSNIFGDANKIIQGGRQINNSEMTMLRATGPRDMGKSPLSPVNPFKDQQLKQLRAQCLVFLAFRNGLVPKKLHLELALGNIFPKDGGNADTLRKELIDHRGKVQSPHEPTSIPEVSMPFGRLNNAKESDGVSAGTSSTVRFLDGNFMSKEADKKMEEKNVQPSDLSAPADERKHLFTNRKLEVEMQRQDKVDSQALFNTELQQPDSARAGLASNNQVDSMENGHLQAGRGDVATSVVSINKLGNPDSVSWTGIGSHKDVPRGSLQSTAVQHELVTGRKDHGANQFHSLGNSSVSEQDDEDRLASTGSPPSPMYTMSEKWIMDRQRKKLLVEQNWVLKQQNTKQRIATCFAKLKETVNSSEDISAKTKSVIELKKLQLLELQRRLRSDFLNDFFKPITTDMDRLRSFKKHKHGRRIKQLEKFELKMKEERQKRIRERQKEFFAEIEVHKERLDDVFKIRRERWKGFNRYVKEFHKRKERIHREKIDRIQREKINLLKINDVEGYLRMVQDAKSDRVKQLLKETEKYLQKLGSKLQDAKTMERRFENDMDEIRIATTVEKNEASFDNEDESDQAKHYLESNEKYYMMAHSIKESIAEQPACLQGGKLREYQMNGLRWLVSLYNNHLNGILADEMGLGKTVQVISLICYLMETKNDRGPFLVVVPSSVLPGWESEINFWAPSVHKIVYSGPPEERRRLFKEKIVHQKFNVLLTTYEYLMNKHDRPKLTKVHWHYIIIDEGHRIKNASCKLNADLKHYQSAHRLLLTGTPLQNNLEELWALLNFLLPNIFNSSEDFSQWFNKPFESNGDNSADEALLSEEENLLIINRLHQVLRPFVLRRLKHKVENQLPEKIERLIRCNASAYQKLLMKRVEENLGSIGNSKARSVHNSVMELRNICNHPYLSQLHVDEVDNLIPKHFLPPIIRLCGKLEMLDRILPKLKATDHRVLFFSTMTRLLDVMEEYLTMKKYRYLRLDGHTSGNDRGALIEQFNRSNSPFFIFLLSIRAGGVGVNLQAADTVIIFDTDWNPQVDLQAQARAHRIGQKRDVLVLRFETVQTVEEQVRASAEHKLGVANQSITAGFFDNNTSAEDRREYLESLLRECKKEEAAPVLDDDSLNDLLARSESEIDVFESLDKQRREEERATWKSLLLGQGMDVSEPLPPLPSRLITDDDLKSFYEVMKLYDVPKAEGVSNIGVGVKRKGQSLGGLDTQHYGRGKRAREVRSYEEQWTEEEFEKMCQVDSPESPKVKEEIIERNLSKDVSVPMVAIGSIEAQAPLPPVPLPQPMEPPPQPMEPPPQPMEPPPQPMEPPPLQQSKEVTPPSKRGRGRPRRTTLDKSPASGVLPAPANVKVDVGSQKGIESIQSKSSDPDSSPGSNIGGIIAAALQANIGIAACSEPTTPSVFVTPSSQSTPASVVTPGSLSTSASVVTPGSLSTSVVPSGSQSTSASVVTPGSTSASFVTRGSESMPPGTSLPIQSRGRGRKAQSGVQAPRRRGRKQDIILPAPENIAVPAPNLNEFSYNASSNPPISATGGIVSVVPTAHPHSNLTVSAPVELHSGTAPHPEASTALDSNSGPAISSIPTATQFPSSGPSASAQMKGQGRKTQTGAGAGIPRRRGRKQALVSPVVPDASVSQITTLDPLSQNKSELLGGKAIMVTSNQDTHDHEQRDSDQNKSTLVSGQDDVARNQQPVCSSIEHDSIVRAMSTSTGQVLSTDVHDVASRTKELSAEGIPSIAKVAEQGNAGGNTPVAPKINNSSVEVVQSQSSEDKACSVVGHQTESSPGSFAIEGIGKSVQQVAVDIASNSQPIASVSPAPQSIHPESVQGKRQGRKALSRVEPPRRRGKKQGLVSTSLDASVGQDPKTNPQSQNKSRDLSGSRAMAMSLRSREETDLKESANVVQETHLPSALVVQDPKRKETAGIPAFGQIQTADITDVARVMKEIFSETCSSKNKMRESSRNEGTNTPVAPLLSKAHVEEVKNQSLEGEKLPTVPTSETPSAQISVESSRESEPKCGAKMEEEDGASPPILKNDGSAENMADAGQPSDKNPIIGGEMDITCTVPVSVGEKENASSYELGPNELAGPSLGSSGNEVVSTVACEGAAENVSSSPRSQELTGPSPCFAGSEVVLTVASHGVINPYGMTNIAYCSPRHDDHAAPSPGSSVNEIVVTVASQNDAEPSGVTDVSSDRPEPVELAGASTGPSGNEIVLAVASHCAAEPSGMRQDKSGNESETVLSLTEPQKSSLLSFGSLESPIISQEAADANDHLTVIQHTTVVMDSCNDNSIKKPEASEKASTLVAAIEGSTLSSNPLNASFHFTVCTDTSPCPCPDSGTEATLAVSGIASENDNKASLRESLDTRSIQDPESLDTRSIQDPKSLDTRSIQDPENCIKDDTSDQAVESATISASPFHSDDAELPSMVLNSSKIEVQPSPRESSEVCAVASRSLEGPTVSGSSDALGDHSLLTRSVAGIQDNLDNVDSSEGFSGGSDLPSTKDKAAVECPEASEEANNCGADLQHGDVTSGCNTANLFKASSGYKKVEGVSSRSKDESDPISEHLHMLSSQSVNVEDLDRVQLSPTTKGSEVDHVQVCNMEIDPSEAPESHPKDFVATSSTLENVLKDTSRMQLPVVSTEVGQLEVCDVKDRISPPEFVISDTGNDDGRADVRPGVGSEEGENVAGCDAGTNLSEAQAPLPNYVAAESISTEDGHPMDISQEDRIVLENFSESTLLPSSLVAEKEDADVLSEKVVIGISPTLDESHGFEADIGQQGGLSQVGEIVPNDVSNDMVLPSSPLTANRGSSELGLSGTRESKEEATMRASEKDLACSLVLEESKGSEAQKVDEMSDSEVHGVVPILEKMDIPPSSVAIHKADCLSDKGMHCSSLLSTESKGSESENNDPVDVSHIGAVVHEIEKNVQMDICQVGEVVPEIENNNLMNVSQVGELVPEYLPENAVLRSSSPALEDEDDKVKGSSEINNNVSSVAQESQGSQYEQCGSMDTSQVGGIVPETLLDSNIETTSCSGMEDVQIEGSLKKSPDGIMVEIGESKSYDMENSRQMVESLVTGIGPIESEDASTEPKDSQVCSIATDVARNTILPISTSANHGENIVGSRTETPEGSKTPDAKIDELAHLSKMVLENVSGNVVPLASSPVNEGEKGDGLSEKVAVDSLVAPLESKVSETKVDDQASYPEVGGNVPEKASDEISSPLIGDRE